MQQFEASAFYTVMH